MRKPGFFKRFWSTTRAPKSGDGAKPSPKLYQPFRLPKPPSDMLLIRRWKGYNRGDLLTILRHWPLRTNCLVLHRRPVFSPLFLGAFQSLQRFLRSRYPQKVEEGAYVTLSLPLTPSNLPLLDMVWEEQPRGVPSFYEEFSSAPLAEVKTPLERRGSPLSSPATGRKEGESSLTKRVIPFLHRLVKGRVSPKSGEAQPLSKAEKLPQEGEFMPSPVMKGIGRILPKLKAKIWPRGMIRLRRVQRGLRTPPEPVVKRGFPQMREKAEVISPSNYQREVAKRRPPATAREEKIPTTGPLQEESIKDGGREFVVRPKPPSQRGPEAIREREETIHSAKRPSPPEFIMPKEEPGEIEEGAKPEMESKETLPWWKSPKPSLEGSFPTSILSVLRTSLWAKGVLARIYPKSHFAVKGKVAPKPREGKIEGIVHHPAVVESPKGDKEEMVTEQGVPFPPLSTPEEESTKAESEILEAFKPSTEEEEISPGFEGRKGTATIDQRRVSPPISPPRPPLAARVLARLYPKYRRVGRKLIKGKSRGVYEGLRPSELGEEIHHVGNQTVQPEPAKSPFRGKILAKVQRKRRVSQKGLSKKAELDQLSTTFEPSPQSGSKPSASPVEDVSFLQPVAGPIFQATQAAFKALAQGPGIPLDMGIRQKFESFFGMGLEEVRIHSGSAAAEVTKGIGAEAVTMGSHIFFSPAVSIAHTKENIGLLAHELTHIVQGRSLKPLGRLVSGKSEGGQPRKFSSEAGDLFYLMFSKVAPQKRMVPPLMAAPLQRATTTPSMPPVTAQITGVSSSTPEEERPRENLEEMALLVYERIKRRLQNEGERLPG